MYKLVEALYKSSIFLLRPLCHTRRERSNSIPRNADGRESILSIPTISQDGYVPCLQKPDQKRISA